MPHCHQHCCCRALQAIFQAVPKQSAAQFGWWQACSVRGEVSPGWFPPFSARSPLHWHPSSPISAIVQMRLCPPFACPPPTSAAFLFPRPTYPRNQKTRQSFSRSSYLRSLSRFSSPPPTSLSSLLLLPCIPPPLCPPSAFQHDKPHGISLVL